MASSSLTPRFPVGRNPAQQFLKAFLETSSEEPLVVVMVVDETQENLLDMRFESITNVAALLKLHNKTSNLNQDFQME